MAQQPRSHGSGVAERADGFVQLVQDHGVAVCDDESVVVHVEELLHLPKKPFSRGLSTLDL